MTEMKDLRFKIDIFGILLLTLSILLMVIGPFWIIDVGGVGMLLACAIILGSTRIARFIERKTK